MTKEFAGIARKSGEMLAFEHYLRTGRRLVLGADAEPKERKFNPYHDPEDGRFTFAPGGSHLASNSSNSPGRSNGPSRVRPARSQSAPKPKPTMTRGSTARASIGNVGALSAKYESRAGGDPGRVSSGAGDPGGVSYGSHQLATNTGTVGAFIAGPEAGRWANEFQGLKPGTGAFSAKWKEIAAREPKAFGGAQDAYVSRTHYRAAAEKVKRATGYDLDRASSALRQVTYSTAVQHGASGGPQVISEAIRKTDRKVKRTDSSYEALLINAIYDRRTEIYLASSRRYQILADQYARHGNSKQAAKARLKARNNRSVATNRYPRERLDALILLTDERRKVPRP